MFFEGSKLQDSFSKGKAVYCQVPLLHAEEIPSSTLPYSFFRRRREIISASSTFLYDFCRSPFNLLVSILSSQQRVDFSVSSFHLPFYLLISLIPRSLFFSSLMPSLIGFRHSRCVLASFPFFSKAPFLKWEFLWQCLASS